MPINLNGAAREAAAQLAQAFQGSDPQALEDAFVAFQQEIADDLAEQYRDALASSDEEILARRGFPQLTHEESEYFADVIEALRSPNPKQALATIAAGDHNVPARMMPETIIDEVMRDLIEQHPLIGIVHATSVGKITTWLRNKHARQAAVWGELEATIAAEITSAFEVVQVNQGKLSCYCAVSRDMLELGPRWMAAYVRTVLMEAMACGLESGIVTGQGNKGYPLGLDRDLAGDVNANTGYPKKSAIRVTSFRPDEYGALVARMAVTDDGKNKETLEGLTLVCNLADYLTKVMPATTLLREDGTYAHDVFPVPTNAITSMYVQQGEAILFLPDEYDLLVGGNRGIEYSDEAQFLNDNRLFKIVSYAFGLPRWNTSALRLDISDLDPAYVTVRVADVVATSDAGLPNTRLASLKIGALALSPTFAGGTTAYTAATTDATNTITAQAEDPNATVTIKNGSTTVTNGNAATWSAGANTVTVTVTNGSTSTVYTVTVTKS